MYIFIFLHQTTTIPIKTIQITSCISLYSYIKPQLVFLTFSCSIRCISLYSYIKPQLWANSCSISSVVYLYIPTSNHNVSFSLSFRCEVVYLYIPTSNHNCRDFFCFYFLLYIFIFLHQTTTSIRVTRSLPGCISLYSYIKPQRLGLACLPLLGCISLYSYIKPQLGECGYPSCGGCISLYSYIKPQLSLLQSLLPFGCISLYSYIKPQRQGSGNFEQYCCISLYSYIKPQQTSSTHIISLVVYLYIPTSNHNACLSQDCK